MKLPLGFRAKPATLVTRFSFSNLSLSPPVRSPSPRGPRLDQVVPLPQLLPAPARLAPPNPLRRPDRGALPRRVEEPGRIPGGELRRAGCRPGAQVPPTPSRDASGGPGREPPRRGRAGAVLRWARRTLLPAPPPRASPSPRGPRPRPPETVPAPSVRSPRRCPPPARVGGRWVSAEKVNEGGGGGSERLTRPGPSTARAPRPPAPWTRRAPRRPSPPPGKWPGGRAARGPGLRSDRTPAPAQRALGAGARALGRAWGRGVPSRVRRSAPGRGRGLCTLCARVVAQVTVSGRGRSTFRAGVFVCARPFWGPRGRSPHRVRAFLSHL